MKTKKEELREIFNDIDNVALFYKEGEVNKNNSPLYVIYKLDYENLKKKYKIKQPKV